VRVVETELVLFETEQLVFETERLIVRTLSQHDLPALAEILSDPEVMEYSVHGVCDEAATSAFIS